MSYHEFTAPVASFKDWQEQYIKRISDTVRMLFQWQALHYTGHFIDCHPEQKERIDEIAKMGNEVLLRWNIKVEYGGVGAPPERE